MLLRGSSGRESAGDVQSGHDCCDVSSGARGDGFPVGRHGTVQHLLVLSPHGLLVKGRSHVGQPAR